jgi:hypothetical protein
MDVPETACFQSRICGIRNGMEIRDRKQFENWLRDQPKDVAPVIALRAALRVLPVALALRRYRGDTAQPVLTSAAFRSVTIFMGCGQFANP